MNAVPTLEFVVSAADSANFARLSGDFNPLHVDALAARRLQFGSTVCHGIHLVLHAIDAAADMLVGGHGVQAVSAVFQQPVRTGVPVRLQWQRDASGQQLRCSGSVDGRPHFSLQLLLGAASAVEPLDPADGDAEDPVPPSDPAFPGDAATQQALAGTVPLRLHRPLLARLFPQLAGSAEGRALAADLMASTRVVGMRCPGLHSIYGEFKLRRRVTPDRRSTLQHEVAKVDPRFRKLRIAVTGGLLEGTLDAFFRAPPVPQRSLAELAALTAPGCTRGQRALVVGGSRGLGELVAKMLLAGGAEVMLTYARGRDDAARTVAEAAALGASASMLALDAAAPLPPETVAQIAAAGFTHLYHFATPTIARNPGGWNQALFESYTRVYVAGFAALARAAAGAAAPLRLFYPSTVFVATPEKGFAEYCAAKAAGETLCDHLALESGRFLVQRPRLPRLKTDQNASFLGPDADDPLPVLVPLLGSFCGWRAETPP